jgi:hypothetical protein
MATPRLLDWEKMGFAIATTNTTDDDLAIALFLGKS